MYVGVGSCDINIDNYSYFMLEISQNNLVGSTMLLPKQPPPCQEGRLRN